MVREVPKKSKRPASRHQPLKPTTHHGNDSIRQVTQLKRKERSEEALDILNKVASLVKPIMKKHSFKVGILCEFFPKDGRLLGLNVNHGSKICLRLRSASNDRNFLPMESILGTMLHELTHNKHGPHDQTFYNFLNSLEDEFDRLLVSGYSGEGFYSKGQALGGPLGSSNLSPSEIRSKAAEAAVKRAGRHQLFAGSGKKLGGANGASRSKPLHVLVREAAERRAADAKWCASQKMEIDPEDLGQDSDVEILDPEDMKHTPSSLSTTNTTPLTTDSSDEVVLLDESDNENCGYPRPTKSAKVSVDTIDLTKD